MNAPPFTVGLRLSLESAVAPRFDGTTIEAIGLWRDQLDQIALREPTSRVLPTNVRPTAADAAAELSLAFGDHPLVTTGRLANDSTKLPDVRGNAFVIAQLVLLPDFEPVRPGKTFPIVDDLVGTAELLHQLPWAHALGSDEARAAADELLDSFVRDLRTDRWRLDG